MADPTLTDADLDLAVVLGTLSSDPFHQTLASGSTLVRYEVTIRDRSPADTVPVAWFDPRRPPSLRHHGESAPRPRHRRGGPGPCEGAHRCCVRAAPGR